MSQYDGYQTDGCVSPACQAQFGASSSLTQGETFATMTKAFHGGRKNSRKMNRKNRRMNGGAADFPSAFDATLPADMHQQANIGPLDKAFGDLPQFVGKYGMSGGRNSRRRHRMRGGVAPITAPAMILTPQEEPAAFLNPQWYTENQVVPSFHGPVNALAAQQYANQFNYAQKAGKRSRKNRKNSRKASRKNSRKNRKASRKNRKASRKNRK